jgi:hypothetical protein
MVQKREDPPGTRSDLHDGVGSSALLEEEVGVPVEVAELAELIVTRLWHNPYIDEQSDPGGQPRDANESLHIPQQRAPILTQPKATF